MGEQERAVFLLRCERIWDEQRVIPRARAIVAVVGDYVRTCAWCRGEYAAPDPRTDHCSRSCAQQHRRSRQFLGE